MFEKEASRLFDANGNIFAIFSKRPPTSFRSNHTPESHAERLIDAIIATEDSRFFQHNGFDAPRFLKASVSQVLGQGGGGASTLTMQLSKLSFTSTEASGIEGIIRKFTDIYLAVFKLEKEYSDKIYELNSKIEKENVEIFYNSKVKEIIEDGLGAFYLNDNYYP